MKVFVFCLLISVVLGEAPYAPSGWKPQGPAFNLPARQQFQAPQPQAQYGLPIDERRRLPNTQYLPSTEPARNFAGNNFASNQFKPNCDLPNDNQNRFSTERPIQQRPTFDFGRQPPGFDEQRNFNNRNRNSGFDQQSGFPANAKLESFNSQQQYRENNGRELEEFSDNRGFEEQETFDDDNSNVPAEEYGAPKFTTERTVNIPRTRTTPKPRAVTENPDNEPEQPNVAVSTAVASGQYYLLQPDGQLQRVIYMASPNPDNTDNGYIANLKYENVEPLKGPIFSYNDSPLVQIN